MTVIEKPNAPGPPSRSRARLRVIGSIILVLGMGGAGLVYWLGTRSADRPQDLALVGYSRAQSRQMGMLYGKMGLLIDDLWDDLQRPGTQAILIAASSALIASGCFYLARFPESTGETR